MANLFAPEINTIGASSLTTGLNVPDQVDYSALFKAVGELAPEPKKITEADRKAEDRQNLFNAAERINQIESSLERTVRFKDLRKRAARDFPFLSTEEIDSRISEYTNELPLGGMTQEEILSRTIDDAYKNEEEMSLELGINMLKAEGDPEMFQQLSLESLMRIRSRDAEMKAVDLTVKKKGLDDSVRTEKFVADMMAATADRVTRIVQNPNVLIKEAGLTNLTGVALSTAISGLMSKEEALTRTVVSSKAASQGIVLTKEQEDRIVSAWTNQKKVFDTPSETLTATNAGVMAEFVSGLSPAERIALEDPAMKASVLEVLKPTLVKSLSDSLKKSYGFAGESATPDALGDIDTTVQGNSDSPTYLEERYNNVWQKGTLSSTFKFEREDKKSIIELNKEFINNPDLKDKSPETIKRLTNNLMYGYALVVPEVDTGGTFLTKLGVEGMFGAKTLSYVEQLAKKNPSDAPALWNQINVTSKLTADRLSVELQSQLNTINQQFLGPSYINPFMFKLDQNGNITGSFNPEAVSKNRYIKNALLNFDVTSPENVDQDTFWKVMRDYVNVLDVSSYQGIKDTVDAMQVLAKTSQRIPDAGSKQTAYDILSVNMDTMFSAKVPDISKMTPEQLRSMEERKPGFYGIGLR